MNIIFAEAISTELIKDSNGNEVCFAKILAKNSKKYRVINKLFESSAISFFLKISNCLSNYVKSKEPLIIVTDWTDPTEMIGLHLEVENEVVEYPNICFLAFNTNWDNISSSGIEDIFGHELSHLWLRILGYNFKLSKSNKFHTCTAITDPYMAFSEGLAEHLEIVTKDLVGNVVERSSFWDYGFDVNAWISKRDEQLRYHGVVNNRFIYHTARPEQQKNLSYNQLHLDHITSSAFIPERIKNGNQMMASEGVIASVFYQIYNHTVFKNAFLDESFYAQFGIQKKDVNPLMNLYLKILYVISKTDLHKPNLMIDFIHRYCDEFSDERKDLYETFLKVTHYSTVSQEATLRFGNLYKTGKRGEVDSFRKLLKSVNEWKQIKLEELIRGEIALDGYLNIELWIEAHEYITPVPWCPDEKSKYFFDINTATEIDLLALEHMTIECAIDLLKIREAKCGYKTLNEFMTEWINLTS